ncbi:MAG: lysostaphin resistance A-like protein [Actinomycetota bacterium]
MDDLRPPPPPVPELRSSDVAPEPTEVPWRAREAFLIVLLSLVTGGFFTMLAVTAIEDETIAVLMATLLIEASLGFWVWMWVRLRHRVGAAALGLTFRRGDVGAGFLAAVIGLAAGAAVTQLVLTIANNVTDRPVETPQQLPDIQHGTELFLAGIAVVIVAPIAEELFFRGFIYQAFRRWRRPWPGPTQAVFFSGIVFAIAHVSPVIMPSIFVLGIILAYLFEKRASVVATIAAHVAYNLIGFIIIVVSA